MAKTIDFDRDYVVFTDGACSGNPGPGGWGAIVSNPDGTVYELGGRELSTTNNRMELLSLIEALRSIKKPTGVMWIFADSVYVLMGASQWRFGWQKRNWRTAEGQPVANQELWEILSKELSRYSGVQVQWAYVPGHKGYSGNERVDQIAVAFSQNQAPYLYQGSAKQYEVNLKHLPKDFSIPKLEYGKGEKKQPYSYLSLIGGIAMRHKTWSECESRVKGQSGAKFKKAMSEEEDAMILAEWGIDSTRLK